MKFLVNYFKNFIVLIYKYSSHVLFISMTNPEKSKNKYR